jgi:hypothetical protein
MASNDRESEEADQLTSCEYILNYLGDAKLAVWLCRNIVPIPIIFMRHSWSLKSYYRASD